MEFIRKRGFSFRNKLIVSFLLVSLLPLLAVQMVSYYVSTEAMKSKINDLVRTNLLQTSKNLDTSLQAYEDLLYQIFTDDEVMALVKEINDPDTDSPELSRRKLINILSRYSYAKDGIRSVAIMTSNDTLVAYDRTTGSPYENLWTGVGDLTSLPIYREAMARRNGEVITPPQRIDPVTNNEHYVFHLARKLSDLNAASLQGIGVAVITVYESVLAHAVNLENMDADDAGQPAATSATSVSSATSATSVSSATSDASGPSSEASQAAPSAAHVDNRSFLTDRDNRIVSSPDKSKIGLDVKDVMGPSTILNTYFNATSNLRINNLIDQQQLFKEMYAMQRLSLYSGVAAAAITAVLIFYFSGRLTRSIRRIVRAMKTAQLGTLDVQVRGKSNDELSVIAFSFNKMMNTVNELMNETKQAGEKRQEAEIRALEAQINPHFLYNTLDSINWMAIEKEEHQISQMLKELAQILRYSVKDSDKRVSVKEELRWMNSYVYLQQHRFRSSFECEVACEETALHFPVYKLLFQPFIENTIIHGFNGFKGGGRLVISVRALDERQFEIRIEDNGLGMPEAKLRELLGGEREREGAAVSGLGIRNAVERVRSYCGDRGSLRIESRPGAGTVVSIVLPIEWKGDNRG